MSEDVKTGKKRVTAWKVALWGFLFGSLVSAGLWYSCGPWLAEEGPDWLGDLVLLMFLPGVVVGFSTIDDSLLFWLGFVVNGVTYAVLALLVYAICRVIKRCVTRCREKSDA